MRGGSKDAVAGSYNCRPRQDTDQELDLQGLFTNPTKEPDNSPAQKICPKMSVRKSSSGDDSTVPPALGAVYTLPVLSPKHGQRGSRI